MGERRDGREEGRRRGGRTRGREGREGGRENRREGEQEGVGEGGGEGEREGRREGGREGGRGSPWPVCTVHAIAHTLGGNFPSSINSRSPDFKCSLCNSALYIENESRYYT